MRYPNAVRGQARSPGSAGEGLSRCREGCAQAFKEWQGASVAAAERAEGKQVGDEVPELVRDRFGSTSKAQRKFAGVQAPTRSQTN